MADTLLVERREMNYPMKLFTCVLDCGFRFADALSDVGLGPESAFIRDVLDRPARGGGLKILPSIRAGLQTGTNLAQ